MELTAEVAGIIVAAIISIVSLFLSAKTEHRLTLLEAGKQSKSDCVTFMMGVKEALGVIQSTMLRSEDSKEAFLKVDWLWKNYESEAAAALKNPREFHPILEKIESGESTYEALKGVDDETKSSFLSWLEDVAANGEGEKRVKARILLGMHSLTRAFKES